MTRYPCNRNGHLSRFEDFAAVRLSSREIMERAIAHRNGTAPLEPKPAEVHFTRNLDLVRYRLNSHTLSAAYKAMGDNHTDHHDEVGDSEWSARFGVIDRESGEPVAMLWIVNDPNQNRGFELADISLSSSCAARPAEIVEVLNELDVPPGHNTSVGNHLADRLDIWFSEGAWETRQPMQLLAFRFSSACFMVSPAMEDTMDVFVELDPAYPLDGGGDADRAYWNLNHYRETAYEKFWPICPAARSGFSSWTSSGEPRVVKVTDETLYTSLCAADNAQASKPVRHRP